MGTKTCVGSLREGLDRGCWVRVYGFFYSMFNVTLPWDKPQSLAQQTWSAKLQVPGVAPIHQHPRGIFRKRRLQHPPCVQWNNAGNPPVHDPRE